MRHHKEMQMNQHKAKWVGLSLLGLSVGLALTACTPKMTLDNDSQSVGMFPPSAGDAAVIPPMSHEVKTQTVTQYVPVPMPGQLMPPPVQKSVPSAHLGGEAAVASANRSALVMPSSDNFFNAMSTYDYMPGALYTVYAAPMRITDIMLAPGEKIISNAAGDTLRWQVSQTYSGQGEGLTQHILVKPDFPNLDNTMVINTNQRVYHLVLKSTSNDTYMVSVNWRYPGSMIQPGQNLPNAESPVGATPAAAGETYGLSLSNLDFNYEFGMLKGKKPGWYPVRVFNDGRQTFIQFPSDFFSTETPVLYVANNNGVYGTMVNWRLKGAYMIVDTVIKQARLQIGIEKTSQTIVQIQHV